MPLFHPNVKKMAERKDIAGLLKVTQEGSPRKRLEAVEAITQIGDIDALQKAIRFQSTDVMSGFWDETIGSVSKLPSADIASKVLLGLLVSDIKEDMQRKAFDTLTGMGTLRDGQLWFRTASTLMDSGRTALGLECLAQAVKSEPSNAEMIGAIASDLGGKAHSESALFEPALTYFQRFTQLEPEDAWGGLVKVFAS